MNTFDFLFSKNIILKLSFYINVEINLQVYGKNILVFYNKNEPAFHGVFLLLYFY